MKLSLRCRYACIWLILAATPALAASELPLEVGKGERLLVLAPHADDESLSSEGLIKRVFENGGTVRLAME